MSLEGGAGLSGDFTSRRTSKTRRKFNFGGLAKAVQAIKSSLCCQIQNERLDKYCRNIFSLGLVHEEGPNEKL